MKTVNNILGNHNIEKQFTDSQGEIAYLIADISDVDQGDIKSLYEELNDTPYKIAVRLLY